jgi:hypothetical protein
MCRPSRLDLEGRSCVVMFRELGLRWTRQRRHERLRAGRIALREPEASCGRAALLGSSRQHSSGNVDKAGRSCGEQASRAYGKTVWSWPSLLRPSFRGCGSRVNRRGVGDFRGAREARTNSAPGRARHKPSTHCAGKAVCLASPVCRCAVFLRVLSHGGPRVPAGTRPFLRPLGSRG